MDLKPSLLKAKYGSQVECLENGAKWERKTVGCLGSGTGQMSFFVEGVPGETHGQVENGGNR